MRVAIDTTVDEIRDIKAGRCNGTTIEEFKKVIKDIIKHYGEVEITIKGTGVLSSNFSDSDKALNYIDTI